jgi:hypothetical protein
VFLQVAAGGADHNRETPGGAGPGGDQMSCTKAVPVITMEKLCEPKLRCSVCDRAREARGRSGDRQDGDRPASPDPKP